MPPRRPTTRASTRGARVPYREWVAWLIQVRIDQVAVPGWPAEDAATTTRVPPGREAGPGRGIHLPLTCALAPAEKGRPKGQRAAIDVRQPASSGCTCTRPPALSAGSSNRTVRPSSPGGSRAAHVLLSRIQAIPPLRPPSRKASPSVVVSGRLPPRMSAVTSAIAQYGFRKRERPVTRPAP